MERKQVKEWKMEGRWRGRGGGEAKGTQGGSIRN
jgi:hypothetical protein